MQDRISEPWLGRHGVAMPTVSVTEKQARQGVTGKTGQLTTIQVTQPSIEILIGGPYSNHTYGHAALRVVTLNEERLYDYGRYGETWGIFGSEGEGVLRVWNSARAYIASENSLGRVTTGCTYAISDEKAKAVKAHFDQKVAGKKPIEGTKSMKSYRIDDYHAIGSNCATLTMGGAKVAIPDLDKNGSQFNKGRGLSTTEKLAARARGWPAQLFMPADIQALLDSDLAKKPTKVTTYRK